MFALPHAIICNSEQVKAKIVDNHARGQDRADTGIQPAVLEIVRGDAAPGYRGVLPEVSTHRFLLHKDSASLLS